MTIQDFSTPLFSFFNRFIKYTEIPRLEFAMYLELSIPQKFNFLDILEMITALWNESVSLLTR